jgi:hypothetical protein
MALVPTGFLLHHQRDFGSSRSSPVYETFGAKPHVAPIGTAQQPMRQTRTFPILPFTRTHSAGHQVLVAREHICPSDQVFARLRVCQSGA